jgi:hypothetical protein
MFFATVMSMVRVALGWSDATFIDHTSSNHMLADVAHVTVVIPVIPSHFCHLSSVVQQMGKRQSRPPDAILVCASETNTSEAANMQALLRGYFPDLKVLSTHEKQFAGQNRARGVVEVPIDGLIVFADADDFYHPDRVLLMVQAFLNHPDAGVVVHGWFSHRGDLERLRDNHPSATTHNFWRALESTALKSVSPSEYRILCDNGRQNPRFVARGLVTDVANTRATGGSQFIAHGPVAVRAHLMHNKTLTYTIRARGEDTRFLYLAWERFVGIAMVPLPLTLYDRPTER